MSAPVSYAVLQKLRNAGTYNYSQKPYLQTIQTYREIVCKYIYSGVSVELLVPPHHGELEVLVVDGLVVEGREREAVRDLQP